MRTRERDGGEEVQWGPGSRTLISRDWCCNLSCLGPRLPVFAAHAWAQLKVGIKRSQLCRAFNGSEISKHSVGAICISPESRQLRCRRAGIPKRPLVRVGTFFITSAVPFCGYINAVIMPLMQCSCHSVQRAGLGNCRGVVPPITEDVESAKLHDPDTCTHSAWQANRPKAVMMLRRGQLLSRLILRIHGGLCLHLILSPRTWS
jgi:hypothetical protein